MANFFTRLFAYFGASANAEFNKRADPRIQLDQALDEARTRHQSLTAQAATVIGNEHHLEARIKRQELEREKLMASARQAILMAEDAHRKNDLARFEDMERAATAFASQLTACESSLEDMTSLLEDAKVASQQAKDAVANNHLALQEKFNERQRLLSQLEQAKMQEAINEATKTMGELAVPGKTPNLDQVRDKIEARAAAAKGGAELQRGSVNGQMMEVQRAALNAGAATRLDQIRASMGLAAHETETPQSATPVLEKSNAANKANASTN